MLEFLESTMWLTISVNLKRDVKESKVIINNMYDRFKNDRHFKILDFDKTLQDSFEYFLKSKTYLNLD